MVAQFNVTGFDEIEKALLKREAAASSAAPEMLKAGAAVLVKAQSAEIKKVARGDRSIGTLANSIAATPVRSYSDGSKIEVYPQGDQPHGTPKKGKKGRVSNAQVGFILEYGRSSNMPARTWMSTANEKSNEEVHAEMRRVWEEKQNG